MSWTSDVAPAGIDPWPACDVHVEGGVEAARLSAMRGDGIVLVDILSFSTSLSIACDRSAIVLVVSPDEAEALEEQGEEPGARGTLTLVPRDQEVPGAYSLSPLSLSALPIGARILLKSLNGAAAAAAADASSAVWAGALRNLSATVSSVSGWLKGHPGARVTIVPCGEMWSSLADAAGRRSALEDSLGAGAIALGLSGKGFSLSAEAQGSAALFQAAEPKLDDLIRESLSGRELSDRGYADDVRLALERDADQFAVRRLSGTPRTFVAE